MRNGKNLRRRGSSLLRGGLLAVVWAIHPSQISAATQVIFDLRASDGTHSVTVNAANQSVSADIFALVAGTDSNLQNDAPSQVVFSLNTALGGLLGDVSISLAAPFNTTTSVIPTATDIDGDGDFELGPGAGATVAKSDITASVFTATLSTVEAAALGTESINGITYSKFKLGTASIKIQNQNFTSNESTTLSLSPRTGTTASKPQKFWLDGGTAITMQGTDPRISPTPIAPFTITYTGAPTSVGPGTLTWAPGGSTGGSGTWDLSSMNWVRSGGATAWPNNLSDAVFNTSAGTVDLASTLINAASVRFDVAGYVLNGAAGATLNASVLNVNADATVTVPIMSTAGVTKNGAGTLILTSVSNYTGGTTVAAGKVVLGGSGNLGDTAAPLAVAGGASVEVTSNLIVGNLSGAGNVTLGAGSMLCTTSGSFAGAIIGFGGVKKMGAGVLTLSAGNAFSGGTTVAGGTLSVSADANLGAFNNPLNVTGGTLQITGTTLTNLNNHLLNSASFNGAVEIANGANAFTIGQSLSGPGSLTKLGPGALALTGNVTYSGGTTIGAGTLAVSSGSGGAVVGSGTLIKADAGTYIAARVAVASLSVQAGTLQIAPNGSTVNTVSAVSVTGAGQLDLSDNDLVVSYAGQSPADSIRALLATGFNSGDWSGAGIASSAAHADASSLTALGYVDTGSAISIKYTYYGDSDLSGAVDAADFGAFLDGLTGNGSTWSQGDYTYDGVVDLGNDFNLFLSSYLGQGGALGALEQVIVDSGELTVAQRGQLLSVVPEPGATVAVVTCGLVGLARRRRVSSK